MSNAKLFLLAVLFLAVFTTIAWQAVIAPTMAAVGFSLPL